jgi:cyanate permease
MGVYSTFMIGFAPFAAMMAGWLADLVGVSITLYISALGVFLSALMYIRWTRKHPIASDDDTGSRN